jgi:GDPmannose 4,6-dehydratase
MSKRAIITGIYGQDGSLLAEYLLARGYRVVGLVAALEEGNPALSSAEIIATDISDARAMREIFQRYRPDECYHLAAAHHSSEQSRQEDMRAQMLRVNFLSTQVMLNALLVFAPECRFLFAGSSQMFSPSEDVSDVDESTPFSPATYYGFTKVICAQLIEFLRRDRGLWGATAILFNHESTRRDKQFVSRKVAHFVARAAASRGTSGSVPGEERLSIQDLKARIDWSAATDFVRAFHLILQADAPLDYVLASGKVHTVEDLLRAAFDSVALDWREHVQQPGAPGEQRPCLRGNPRRAREVLGWEPEKTFDGLIREMVEHDLQLDE